MRKTVLILYCSLLCFQSRGQGFSISGHVFDSKSGNPLSGANVVVDPGRFGMVTDGAGNFTLHVKDSVVTLYISFVGYRSVSRRYVINNNEPLNIGLEPGKNLTEVIVSDNKLHEPDQQVNRVILPIRKVESLPMVLGEPDIMKALQLLPGVQSGMEGTSGIEVRGGGPGENLVLLDNIPVYNSDHLFGLFSPFNYKIIRQVDLIKGGFPARFGGRLSSVIDMQTREGNDKKYDVEGSIGIIASNLLVSGPVIKNKISFIAGFRRSYLDLFSVPISKLLSKGNGEFGYYFQDLNGKLNWKLNEKQDVYLILYKSNDNFYTIDKTSYRQDSVTESVSKDKFGLKLGNSIISSGMISKWSKRFQTLSILAYNQYRFQVYSSEQTKQVTGGKVESANREKASLLSRIADINFKSDALYSLSKSQNIRFGFDLIYHRYIPELYSFQSNVDKSYTFGSDSVKAYEENFYLEDEIRFQNHSVFKVGLRNSNYQVNGRNYRDLEPRLSLDLVFPGNWHLNASCSRMEQYTHLLMNGQLGLPVQYWVPVTAKTEPQIAAQTTFGMMKDINTGYSFSITGYYKNMYHLLEYTEDSRVYNIDLSWEDRVETGNGKAYGIEFFAQKKLGRITGWIAYTLSRSLRQFDHLNSGNTFPYTYDRIHDISVTGNYHLNDNIEISADWMFSTGIAYTAPLYLYPKYPVSSNVSEYPWQWQDNALIGYTGRNAERYPSFHRLDLGIQFQKKKKWGERAWVISIINVYNRRNPFYLQVGYNENFDQKQLVMHSVFQMIPSVSYRFRFN